jgi:hypothetical protein
MTTRQHAPRGGTVINVASLNVGDRIKWGPHQITIARIDHPTPGTYRLWADTSPPLVADLGPGARITRYHTACTLATTG